MKATKTIALSLLVCIVIAGSVSAERNVVGDKIEEGARLPGQTTQSAGSVVESTGKRLQPATGNRAADAIAGSPGKVVELGGKGVAKTGELLEGVGGALTGAPVEKSAKADLKKPVNCASARADIATLESEKRSSLERAGQGIKSVLPATAAIRLLGGTYTDGVRVTTGDYNKDLDAKIARIERSCGIG